MDFGDLRRAYAPVNGSFPKGWLFGDRISNGLQASGNLLDWDPVIPMANIELATHEWIGLLIYWLTGKIDALFPAPNREGMQASQSSLDALEMAAP